MTSSGWTVWWAGAQRGNYPNRCRTNQQPGCRREGTTMAGRTLRAFRPVFGIKARSVWGTGGPEGYHGQVLQCDCQNL